MSSLPYVPILIFILIALAFPLAVFAFTLLIRPDRPVPEKLERYECGIESQGEVWGRFSVQYYVIAVLFLIFDVETVFLFPWAVRYRHLGLFGFVEMAVFILVLVVAYAYAWKKGALEWA
ncbi:MAG: NADH-quinone oxidoreductase subunit A [Acidobacteriia bacterium]|nr:NADH-quinone oxidoreductase subunit A [Terriglobia bacterium]